MIDSRFVAARRGQALERSPGAGSASGLFLPSSLRRASSCGCVGSLTQQSLRDVGDLLAQRLGSTPSLEVVGDLLLAAAVGLVDGLGHRVGQHVRIHVHLAGDVAGGAPDRLDERGR